MSGGGLEIFSAEFVHDLGRFACILGAAHGADRDGGAVTRGLCPIVRGGCLADYITADDALLIGGSACCGGGLLRHCLV